MLQEFVALEKTIEQALGVQLKSTQELSGRPESDIKRFDGKLTLLYEVTNPKYDEQLKFAFRAWVDERASGQVFAITLYDNVVAGKRLSRDLVYRNTLYLPYGPIQPHTWSVLLEQLNAWMQRSATQSLPDVKSGKELSF